MPISEKLVNQGNFLFRWRSFLPLFLVFPALMGLSESAHFRDVYGETIEDMWVLVGFVVSILGLAVRWVTVGFVPGHTSGRNTKEQRAEVLNTTGIYSTVRNPLYLGNYLALLGVLISLKLWWLVLAASLAYWLYIERIIAAEEAFLTNKFGDAYLEWARKTPVFIPNFALWENPELTFSWKTVLRREYNGLMAVCTAFFVTELVADVLVDHEPLQLWLREDWPWVGGFAMAAVMFLTLRTLKKHTQLLRVQGR